LANGWLKPLRRQLAAFTDCFAKSFCFLSGFLVTACS
jgi:hypothetical protein